MLGEEREPSFSGTVDFLVVNPFLSSMFSVREYRSIFQQIVNGMEFSDYDTVRPYRQVNEYGLYCGGFISLDEDVVFFNGKPYQTDEKKVEQLRDFYTRINDLVVNAEKPFEGVAIQSVTTSDKDGNTMTMDQEQCSVLSLLIQDIAVYEPITEPSIWEWSTIYIGDLLLGDGSHIELYAGQEVVVVNGVMLHVSIDSSNNLIHFIKAIRSK